MWLHFYLCPYDDPEISSEICGVVKNNGYMCYMSSLRETTVTIFTFEFAVSQIAWGLLFHYASHLCFAA